MPKPDFQTLKKQLLRAGVAPRHVRRSVAELGDHFDDLVDAALDRGMDRRSAERDALRELGDLEHIADAINARPELRCWARQYPRVAAVFYPLACVAVLPAVPVIVGVVHAPLLARWATCIFLSGLVTAAMLLVLHLSLTLT